MSEFLIGDIVQMRKKHPCGGDTWEVQRIGMDFRIKCQTCQHSLLLPRRKFEKSVRQIISRGDPELTAKQRPFFDYHKSTKKQENF